MSALPDKPEAVAHVSDAHWKAALDAAVSRAGSDDTFAKLEERGLVNAKGRAGAADYARCLILLGEVPAPVDPITLAASHVWHVANGPHCDAVPRIEAEMRKHLAGVTFPSEAAELVEA